MQTGRYFGRMHRKTSNSYLLKGAQRIANNTNINTITAPGNYQVTFAADATTMTNLPYNTAGILKVEKSGYASDNYIRQIYKLFDAADAVYVRSTVNGGSSWTDWVKEPTRAEMDALTNKMALVGVASSLVIASNNNAEDTCFFRFDRSDGIQYKVAFGTNNSIYFQKFENGEWTTIWTK